MPPAMAVERLWPSSIRLRLELTVLNPRGPLPGFRSLQQSHNIRGAAFMAVSMAGFTANDTMTKFVSASMNMAEVMLIRGLFATVLVALLAWSQGALANPRQALN